MYLLQSAKSEDDGSLVLGDDADAEEDGDGEGEDNEDDGEDYQQNRTTIIGGFLRLIGIIHPHNLEGKSEIISRSKSLL